MVDEVKRERLHEGFRLLTMGGGGGERRVRPRQRGREIIMVGSFLLSSACFCREPAEGIIWREKKSFFPPQVGNIPAEVGKNPTQKRRTIVLGTVVSCIYTVLLVQIAVLVARPDIGNLSR